MHSPESADIARLFHLHSSNARGRAPDLAVDEDRRPFRFRTYPGALRISLPVPNYDLGPLTIGEAMLRRRSSREFALRPLDLIRLSKLLHVAYGVRGHRQVEGEWSYDRATPSAGGLYPLELYVATQQVEGLDDGVYHYDARAHELELRRPGIVHSSLADMTIGQDMIRDANLVVIISAVAQRTMWKYGQRGYRYVWLDAGHVGQNLYLATVALGLGAAAIGGFFDAEVNRLIAAPTDEEAAIYLLCIGQPTQTS